MVVLVVAAVRDTITITITITILVLMMWMVHSALGGRFDANGCETEGVRRTRNHPGGPELGVRV